MKESRQFFKKLFDFLPNVYIGKCNGVTEPNYFGVTLLRKF